MKRLTARRVPTWLAVSLAVAALTAGMSAALVAATPSATSIPACVTEDATGPCYWDASKSGNGIGRSFTVDHDGTVTYDADR